MSEPTRVEVGGDTYTIEAFTGYKAVRAGGIISRISEAAPDILTRMGEFEKEYESANELRLTREMAKLPRFCIPDPENEGALKPLFTEEDFAQAAAEGRDYIPLPKSPSTMEKWMSVFPQVFTVAEKELKELLGLVTISDEELEAADEADTVTEELSKKGREVLHKGTVSEMLELLVAAGETLQAEFQGKEQRLEGVLGLLGMTVTRPSPSGPEPSSDEPEPSEPAAESETSEETTPNGNGASSEPSSTASPAPTDGAADTSSTESVGSSSSSSESA